METSIASANRDTAAADLPLYAAGFAFGIAVCMAGALQGVVNLLALYVLQSTRGASVEVWLQTWEGLPAWGLLVSLVAASLGSWTTVVARTRPDPRRSALALAALLTLTLGGAWLGGDAWIVIGLGALWQLIAAWWLAARLSRFALDAAGAKTGIIDSVHQAQGILLSAAGAVVVAWALSSLAPVQLVDSPWLEAAATFGMIVALVCGVLYLSGLRQRLIESELKAANAKIDPGFWRSPPRFLAVVVIAVVCLAALMPADLSPLHIRDFNRWMESLTDRIGPLLVPSARIDRGGQDGLLSRLADVASQAMLVGARQTGTQSPLRIVGQVALFAAGLVTVWRILRRKQRPLEPSIAAGNVPFGFRWLLSEMRQAILRLLARLGWYGKGGMAHPMGAETSAPVPRRPRTRLSRLPSNVILIYLHVIERLGERGLARRPSETPLEFLKRWRERSAAPDDRGLPALTRLFLAVRYGGGVQHDELLRGARQAASTALRGWRRDALATRLRSWIRVRKGDEER